MRSSMLLLAFLTITGVAAERDPHADGAGGDPLPEVGDLVASEALPGVAIAKNTEIRLVADHEGEGVFSPTALTFDEKGVLYLAETHRFRFGIDDNRSRGYWLMDDFAAQTVEDRAKMYEKWREKVPLEMMTERSEKVRRLSDQASDGRYQKSEVFADGFNDQLDGTAAGVFAYDGTLFLANIPKIYALRDQDGDGKAEFRGVIEDGFGVRVSFSGHDMNGFALGPDGRIYGTIGDRGFNVETAEGKHYKHPDQGAVFRFEPDGTNFEVIHTGLRNPKEIAFDAYGNAFTVDNNSDQKDKARIVYIVDGADSGWRMECQTVFTFYREIGLDQAPPSAWMNERMWEPENEDQPAWLLPPVANLTSGPSGLTYYPGAGFLESEEGRFLICDYRGGAANSGVWSFKVEPDGAGMKMVDARTLVWGIGATDVEYRWDGRVFITDFVTGWTSHEDGRVLEISAQEPFRQKEAEEAARLFSEGFGNRPLEELGRLLAHADMRVRIRAQLALTRREGGLPILENRALEGDGFSQLHGIWGLGIVARRGAAAVPPGGPSPEVDLANVPRMEKALRGLTKLLAHEDPEVRAQAVRVLGEVGDPKQGVDFSALLEDPSSRVRMFAAISAGRTGSSDMWDGLVRLLESNSDEDRYLRHAGVYAMEQLAKPGQLVGLSDHESAALRLAAVIALGRSGDEGIGRFIDDEDPRVSNEAIRLIHDRSIEAARSKVAALVSQNAERSRLMWRRILHSAFRIGGQENLVRVLDFALDRSKPKKAREEALRLLSIWSEPPLVDQSLGCFAPLPKRDAGPIKDCLQSRTADLLALKGKLLDGGMEVIDAYQFDLSSVPGARLKAMIFDSDLQLRSRQFALKLYVSKNEADLDDVLLQVAGLEDGELAVDGLSLLVKRKSAKLPVALRAAFESDQMKIRQQAWKLSEGVGGEDIVARYVEGLAQLTEQEGAAAEALELLESARERPEPEIKQALDAFDAKIKASSDPLVMWKPALEGGDAMRGKLLFEAHPAAQCSRCHAAGHGQAGPVLDGVASRGDRRFMLESMVSPAAKVAAGFGVVVATLKDGTSVGGILSEEEDDAIVLDVAGEKKRLARSEISELSQPVSSMPPMSAILQLHELRDLVAWLVTQDQR